MFRLRFFLAGFVATVAFGANDRPDEAIGSRARCVVVVDARRAAQRADGLARALADSLRRTLAGPAAASLEIVELDNARGAIQRWEAGRCHAVVLLGANRPRAFRRPSQVLLAFDLGAARGFLPAYLMVDGEDDAVRREMASAFAAAVERSVSRAALVTAAR